MAPITMEINDVVLKERVWIVNYAGHDYSDASRYGDQCHLTVGYVSLMSLDRVKFDLSKKIFEETQSEDWLLLSGKPLVCVICALAWFMCHNKVKLLVWDQKKRKEKYRELIITKENLSEIFDVISNGD